MFLNNTGIFIFYDWPNNIQKPEECICEKSNVYVNVKSKTNFLIKCSRKTHTNTNKKWSICSNLSRNGTYVTYTFHIFSFHLTQSYSKYNFSDWCFINNFSKIDFDMIDLSTNNDDDGMFETDIEYFFIIRIKFVVVL